MRRFCIGLLALADIMIGMHSAATATPCLSDAKSTEQVAGRLTIGRARDGAGRPEYPYILKLKVTVCLKAADPADDVKSTRTAHVFSSNDAIAARFKTLVGKSIVVRGRPMPAMTVHHHAPIILDVTEIIGN